MSGPRQELREKEPVHRLPVGLVLSLAVTGLLAAAVAGLPRGGNPLPGVARQALDQAVPLWRTTEPVSEVVYGTRAFDTFGETFLLLAAVVSVIVLTRGREQRSGYIGEEEAGEEEQRSQDPEPTASSQEKTARAAEEAEEDRPSTRPRALPDDERVGTPAPETAQAMSVVVRTTVRFVLPVLSVAGLYLVIQGYSPGGGFPAGGVALGVVLLVYAGFGYRLIKPVVKPSLLEVAELAGALAIIVVLTLGLVLSGSITANWVRLAPEQSLRSGGTMQLFSLFEFVEVGTGLTIVVFSIMGMLHDWTPDEDDGNDQDPGVER